MEGKFVVKTSAGFFNAVAPDIKLEQSIQWSTNGAGGIIGQTSVFVTELVFHEVLNISKSYSNITRSVLAETYAATLNKELRSKNMKEYYEAVKQIFDFFFFFLMKETILTKWLGQSSYIILSQSKLYPAINQTAYCIFWRMGAKIN